MTEEEFSILTQLTNESCTFVDNILAEKKRDVYGYSEVMFFSGRLYIILTRP